MIEATVPPAETGARRKFRLSFRLIHPRPEPVAAVHATDGSTGMNGPEQPRIMY